MNEQSGYAIRRTVRLAYADAVEQTKRALQEQGFGVCRR